MTTLPATWPIPAPADIFSQGAAVFEANFTGIDARSAFSVAATYCRIAALTGYDLYCMQANLAQELMVNTANLWLSYHADIWNVPQLQPTAATGNAIFAGTIGTPIPSGTLLSFSGLGWIYMTTTAASIGSGGTVSIPIVAALAGSAYNLPGGTVLQLVSPIGGVSPSAATLDVNGAANGTDLEIKTAWQARVVAAIGEPGSGGNGADYVRWARAAGAAYVNVVPQAVGPGSVGIYIAAPGPSVASPQLVAAAQAALGNYGTNLGERPVTARALVMASTLVPVNVTLHMNPDSALTRAAAISGLGLFFLQSAQQQNQSGPNTLYMSRLDNAISSASGEFSHERYAPTGDLVFTPSEMFVLGAVFFE